MGSLKYGSGRLTDMKHVNNRILWYQKQLRYTHVIKISNKSSWVAFVAGLGWSLMFMSQKQLPGPLLPTDGSWCFWTFEKKLSYVK